MDNYKLKSVLEKKLQIKDFALLWIVRDYAKGFCIITKHNISCTSFAFTS